MGKKNEFTFNIGFNPNNADHVEVAGILNELGRGKAAYLVKAVQFYREYDQRERGGAILPKGMDHAELENLVRRIVMEQNGVFKKYNLPEIDNQRSDKMREIENEKRGSPFLELEYKEISSIMDALQSFKEK